MNKTKIVLFIGDKRTSTPEVPSDEERLDTLSTEPDEDMSDRPPYQPYSLSKARSFVQSTFLPGRLNNIEILERVFPFHRKSVLELVLQGCNGDLVKAIEQFLSSNDTMTSQAPGSSSVVGGSKPDYRVHPYLNSLNHASANLKAFAGKLPPSSLRSAFTPLSSLTQHPNTMYNGLHSAFSTNHVGMPGDSIKSHMIQPSMRTSDFFTTQPQFPYPVLGPLGSTPLPGFLGSPFSMYPYRTGFGDMNCFQKSSEKVEERAILPEVASPDAWSEKTKEHQVK